MVCFKFTDLASLRKDASSALIGLGEAISGNATSAEIDTFIGGILAQESYARSSCLQAIQVTSLIVKFAMI